MTSILVAARNAGEKGQATFLAATVRYVGQVLAPALSFRPPPGFGLGSRVTGLLEADRRLWYELSLP